METSVKLCTFNYLTLSKVKDSALDPLLEDRGTFYDFPDMNAFQVSGIADLDLKSESLELSLFNCSTDSQTKCKPGQLFLRCKPFEIPVEGISKAMLFYSALKETFEEPLSGLGSIELKRFSKAVAPFVDEGLCGEHTSENSASIGGPAATHMAVDKPAKSDPEHDALSPSSPAQTSP